MNGSPNRTFNELILFYFSGTGNAKRTADWIEDEAKHREIPVSNSRIDRSEIGAIATHEPRKTLIGFLYPTHGFNAAPIMLKFIFLFPRSKGESVFLLNTRAGMKMGKLFLPGISGLAQFLPALIFLLKGYKIVGMQPLDLPSNWISLHPGLRKKVIGSIYGRCQRITGRFISKILSGKKVWKAFLSLPIDLLVAPIAVGYYFVGRFAIAKTFYATNACDDCGVCYNSCPVKAIKLVDGRPYWRYNCESCMRCMNHCPQRAIETSHGVYLPLIFIGSGIFTTWVTTMFLTIPLIDQFAISFWVKILLFILNYGLFIIPLYLGYRLFHYLMRWGIINALFKYTSLTTYTFWRRYKAPKQV